MERPVRREGRSQSPNADKPINKTSGSLLPCRQFLKGNCKRGDDCCFAHADQAEADRLTRAQAKAKGKAKAKAKAKAEPKAGAAAPAQVAVPALVPTRSE